MESFGSDDRQTAVRVAQYQYGIGTGLYHQFVGTVDDVAHRSSQVIAYGVKIDVRIIELEVAEKNTVEVVVVILSGVCQERVEIAAALIDDGGQPDDLWTGSDQN